MIFGFVMKCKLKVNSLILTKKEGMRVFRIGLGWIHKQEFRMKSICINQAKTLVIINWNQNGTWMRHMQPNSQNTLWPTFVMNYTRFSMAHILINNRDKNPKFIYLLWESQKNSIWPNGCMQGMVVHFKQIHHSLWVHKKIC